MKLLSRAFLIILVLGIAYTVLVPNYVACGSAGVTIRVRVLDAATHQPIPLLLSR
jgi:hypothetical protein